MGLLDSFTGASAAKHIKKGTKNAMNELGVGQQQAHGHLDAANADVQPFQDSGLTHQNMFDDLTGANGPEARARAQAMLESDPLFAEGLANDSNAIMRQLNARGLGGSGVSALAGRRVLLENYMKRLGLHAQQGGQGFQAGLAAAGIDTDRANLDFGVGQQKADLQINKANALAENSNTFANNMLAIGGIAAKAYGA